MINDAIVQILQRNQFENCRNPGGHAGGKMVWRYHSVLGQKGNLEIDLNYMYRQPLFEPQALSPAFDQYAHLSFPVLDIHELVAGKLSAMFSRLASRDIFDAHQLLTRVSFDADKLRFAFVTYMAMTGLKVEQITVDSINPNLQEFHDRLLPVLRRSALKTSLALSDWVAGMVVELRQALSQVLPLHENEAVFIRHVECNGQIHPELITQDEGASKYFEATPRAAMVGC